MIITIKNLQQQTFTVDFDSEKTVLELKEVIYKTRGGEYNIEKQKLIYAGIILEDDRTVSSYNVDEKKFVVVMLKRDVRDENKANKESLKKETEPKDTKAPDEEKLPEKKTDSPDTATTTSSVASNSATATQPQFSAAESNLLMGEEYNRSVDYLIEMGYSREMVERAMAASYNNPDRAVEYLISGIPDISEADFGTEEIRGDGGNNERADRRTSEGGSTRDPFEFLRDQPQFLQMRQLVYQNPDLLHAVLQQIGQTNPALLQLISENQDAFLNMLNQPVEGQEQSNTSRRESSPDLRAQLSALSSISATTPTDRRSTTDNQTGRSGDNRARNTSSSTPSGDRTTNQPALGVEGEGPAVIRLTRAEQDAIERLKAMGFPEALVLQAYFACDKDEQLAANFLVSSAFED